jgi:aspartyl-tRNA(Asn)/glutamyl-tRNA(Gln) amidotransferase subunit C
MDAEELFTTARMARLTLTPEEVEKLRQAVERMLGYFAELKDVDVGTLKPTTHALLKENAVREDREAPWTEADLLLDNAPQREDRFIVIPNVL